MAYQKKEMKNKTVKSGTGRSSTGKNGAGKSSTGKSSIAKSSTGRSSIAKSGTGRSSIAKSGIEKNGTGKSSIGKNGTGKSSIAKNSTGKSNAGNRWKRETGNTERTARAKQIRDNGKNINRNDSKNDNRNIEGKLQRNSRVKVVKEKTIGCPIYKKCGGCLGQEVPYETHLEHKQKELQSLLGSFCKLEPIIGMQNPYHYRNKVHAVFAHDKKGPYCGVYEEGTHRVVPVEKCFIENEKATQIILSIRDLLSSFKIRTFDEDTGYGLLRHVLVRTGYKSGEIMVVLVLSSTIMPSKNNFVKALRKIHPEITTILINENYKNTSMILGDKEQTIYGKGFIYDTLCGKTFRISAKSFYQVNPVQTEILYKKAIQFAELTGTDTVLDAYCGIGTIGMIASDYVRRVIGVELNADAVRDAVSNARKNQIKNIDFYTKDASIFMTEVAEAGTEKIDVVFMDPPRAGSTEQFMDACVELAPGKIVYISCNPHSLARDLEYMTKRGYQVKKAVGVDLFPWTKHVETVVLLSREKVDGYVEIDLAVEKLEGKSGGTATYAEIKAYIEEKYGFKVSSLYIGQIKNKVGIKERKNYNTGSGEGRVPNCPAEKEEAIMDAFKHFKLL